MKLELFQYDLPSNFIAQEPVEKRDHSKMLLLDRKTGQVKHDYFYNIINYLADSDILVVNESKVRKCRICGAKEKTGAIIECFLLEKLSDSNCLVLLRPSKRIKQKDRVNVGRYYYDIIEKLEYGKAVVKFSEDIEIVINEYGKVPLPPYIKNEEVREERYQTIYAKKPGSAAAPTAGFHFTEKLIADITGRGIKFAKLTLDIGLDTFRPVVEEEIEEHVIHSESYFLSDEEAFKINEVKKRNGRIIAVGTTTTRVLETIAAEYGCIKGAAGKTSLYIYPGYKFKAIDALVTNFHLPGSTLIIMVSAFAGRKNILDAYEEAKNNNYRFFSFGDCMFIN